MTVRTEKSFSERKKDRDEGRAAKATALLVRAMAKAGTCVTRCAFKLGMSESLLRKYRDGGAQFGLHDILGLAAEEPETFDALLEDLAALRGKVVVGRVDGQRQAAIVDCVIAVTKEGNEASSAVLDVLKNSDPATLRRAIAELEQSSQADHSAIELFRSMLTTHETQVQARLAARGLQ